MRGMFCNCFELEYLDLSNFDTSNVIDMEIIFNGCQKLKELNGTKNFNTHNVKLMTAMFQSCFELKNLDLSNFDTYNVENMKFMFNECYKLKEIKGVNKFITDKVIDMTAMFQSCFEMEMLDLSNSDTSNVTSMQNMFSELY